MLAKFQRKSRRASRTRAHMLGTASKPRLSIFRSNTEIYAQAIDDVTGVTLCSASSLGISTGTKTDRARQVGTIIGEALVAKKIATCVFDRGGCIYHGRIQALAEATREAGILF